ncbi:hypothetical protein [Thalassospira marina]|uniref:Uncharacterized protein n=1 Tax=Thalassospira marina TaxID=2048283 RepID=A0A2N3KV20_9PROT|nr:hypothetical protein [Thalassospira marina]PKR54431.1 hypothetical protein COO20_09890 [Thalassospira marina]
MNAAQEVQAFLDRVRGRSLEPEKASVHFYHGGWESIELATLQALVNEATLKELVATPVPGPQFPISALDCSADDDGGWNLEGSGLCSVSHFSAALEAWFRGRSPVANPGVGRKAIAAAADALGASPDVVIMAGLHCRVISSVDGGYQIRPPRRDVPEDYGLIAAIQLISVAHGDAEGSMPVADIAAYLNLSRDVIRRVVPAAGAGPSVMYIENDRIVHEGVE